MNNSEKFEKARKAAYKFLTYRARTEYEITEKLLKKGFDGDTVSQVVKSLREYRMLDDQAYAERYVAGRSPLSRAAISGELRKRGVHESIIDGVLEGFDSEAEFRIALAQARSRIKRRGAEYPLISMAAFLRRRGFNQEAVDRVCDYLENMRQP